jgi:hypothetical protein
MIKIYVNDFSTFPPLKQVETLENSSKTICARIEKFTSIRLLGMFPKGCYTLARIGSRSRRTSKVHSA